MSLIVRLDNSTLHYWKNTDVWWSTVTIIYSPSSNNIMNRQTDTQTERKDHSNFNQLQRFENEHPNTWVIEKPRWHNLTGVGWCSFEKLPHWPVKVTFCFCAIPTNFLLSLTFFCADTDSTTDIPEAIEEVFQKATVICSTRECQQTSNKSKRAQWWSFDVYCDDKRMTVGRNARQVTT